MMGNLKRDKRLYILIILTVILIVIFTFSIFQSRNIAENISIALLACGIQTSILLIVNYVDAKKKHLELLEELDREIEEENRKKLDDKLK